MVNDLVMMNDTVCRHKADYGSGVVISSFPDPEFVYTPQTETKRMSVKVYCPICRKSYSEASKRMKKEILTFMSQLSESSMFDEATSSDQDGAA